MTNKFVLTLWIICALFSVSFGQDDMEGSSCPMRSLDGPYSYDPTSMSGPMSWGFLKPEYAKCTTGMQQSPIDFPRMVKFEYMMKAPSVNLMKSNMTLKPLPFNWELQCNESQQCGYTMFNDTTYFVSKVRFNKPAQHTLNGTRYPFEVSIEHKSMENNKTIVVARLFNVKKQTGYFYKIAKKAYFDVAMNKVVGTVLKKVKGMNNTMMIDLPSMINSNGGFCSYMGSESMPPCKESVMYFLSMDVGVISRKQIHHYWATTGFNYDGNSRPTKPINGRHVTCFVKPDIMKDIEMKKNNLTMNTTMTNGDGSMTDDDDMDEADISENSEPVMVSGDDTEEIDV